MPLCSKRSPRFVKRDAVMTTLSLTINDKTISTDVEPRMHLADLLREKLRATGTHLGCEHGVCGSCTVLLDDMPIRSCVTLAVACEGRVVRTIEGFANDSVMEELRSAFSREHALQCGFCTSGMLIAARDIVLRLPAAGEERVRRELAGNLCRCTGYLGIVRAVLSVIEKHRAEGAAASVPPAAAAPEGSMYVSVRRSFPMPSAMTGTKRIPEMPSAAVSGQAVSGWTVFAQSFIIRCPAEETWSRLDDLSAVASCIPGAELLEQEAGKVKGRMTIRIGPITAAFTGTAVVAREDATMTGTVRGAGSDSTSKSRSMAVATYRVRPEGPMARVELEVRYNIQGPLAQFSRSSLAQEIGRRLVNQFAQNLNHRLLNLSGAPGDKAALNVSALLWSELRERIVSILAILMRR